MKHFYFAHNEKQEKNPGPLSISSILLQEPSHEMTIFLMTAISQSSIATMALQSMKSQILKRSLGTAPKAIARQDKNRKGVFISLSQNDLISRGFSVLLSTFKIMNESF